MTTYAGEENEATAPDVGPVLRDWAERVRMEMAGKAPAYDEQAGLWAASAFYRACQLAMDRDPPEAVVRKALAAPCPAARGSVTDYSVDLVFRFLPDLLRLAEQRAPDDAVVDVLRGWAREWPLSSVGLAVDAMAPGEGVLEHVSLRRLYLDRIFERGAKDRLADPRLRRWIEADAGPYAELEGRLAALAPSAGESPGHSENPQPSSFS